MKIQQLSESEISAIASMLARAFWGDPLFKYALPDDNYRLKKLAALFVLNLKYGLKFGEVFLLRDQAVAIWLKPGMSQITVFRALRAGMWSAPFAVGPGALGRLGQQNSFSENLHEQYAAESHWYLFMLGVEPSRQGGGLGSRIIEPVLAQADACHQSCYLDTYNSQAVRFYQKNGFEIVSEQRTGKSGLRLWAMRRK